MKRIILIIFTLLMISSVSAQNSYIGINLGRSIPEGDMGGNEDLFNDGYAVSGFSIQFDGIYFPGSVFGIGGILGFGSYYTQTDPYFISMSAYINSHPDNPSFEVPDKDQVLSESGFWNCVNILVGPELAVPFLNFQFGIRAMGGTSLIITPKRKFYYEGAMETMFVKTDGADLSFSYMYGTNLAYFLNSGTSIRIAADYFSSKADYNFIAEIETPLGEINEERKERVELNTIQLSIGLSYAF